MTMISNPSATALRGPVSHGAHASQGTSAPRNSTTRHSTERGAALTAARDGAAALASERSRDRDAKLPDPIGSDGALARRASKQVRERHERRELRQVQAWKEVDRAQLTRGIDAHVSKILDLARGASAKVDGTNLDLSGLEHSASTALELLQLAEQSIESWSQAHPKQSVPSELSVMVDRARDAIRSMPRIELPMGTEDGSPVVLGGPWPDWATGDHEAA